MIVSEKKEMRPFSKLSDHPWLPSNSLQQIVAIPGVIVSQPGSEAILEFPSPYPGLINVARVIGEVDAANGIVFIGDVAGKKTDFEVPGEITITEPQTTFELCPKDVFNTFVKKVLGFALDFPVGEQAPRAGSPDQCCGPGW